MALTDIQLFNRLRTKMQWHEARQGVLAQNVANADTPNYRARDLKDVDFGGLVQMSRPEGVGAVRTHTKHMAGPQIGDGQSPFDKRRVKTFEVTPEGNSVVLEEEMMKVTQNQLDFQTVSTLYQRSIGMLRSALGRSA